MDGYVVSTERVIPAPADKIFDLIADPSRHPDIDGSGTVKQAKGAGQRVGLGDTFGMSMHMGISYTMANTVIEFEENRRIAWQTRVAGFLGSFVGGRIWRYELEPVDGGTRVTESWDISEDHQRMFLKRGPTEGHTKSSMDKTLARIEELVAGDPAPG
jgi:uncharacterized protein YndB with AHSA1/START domain